MPGAATEHKLARISYRNVRQRYSVMPEHCRLDG
jgi:hypothetical protein